MSSLMESQIQIAICDYLSLIAGRYGLLFFSVPNEAYAAGKGKRTLSGREYGKINNLKRMGLTPGVSDLVLVHKGKTFFVEVKRQSGKLSENQKVFRQNALNAGAEYAVIRSVDEIETALKIWGITK